MNETHCTKLQIRESRKKKKTKKERNKKCALLNQRSIKNVQLSSIVGRIIFQVFFFNFTCFLLYLSLCFYFYFCYKTCSAQHRLVFGKSTKDNLELLNILY